MWICGQLLFEGCRKAVVWMGGCFVFVGGHFIFLLRCNEWMLKDK